MSDDSIYFDDWGSGRAELENLLGVVQEDDTLMLRSIVDLGDTIEGILERLSLLKSKGVEIASVMEPWYDGKHGLEVVESV